MTRTIALLSIAVLAGCTTTPTSVTPGNTRPLQGENQMIRTGGCFCGNIRYEITGVPLHETVCHCAGCRRSSGSGSVPWITVKTSDFKLTQGELAEVRSDKYPRTTCDGCGGVRVFCPNCGTPIAFRGDGRAERETDITVGSLDDPENFSPKEDVFAKQRLPWVALLK